ncbi:MAG: BamA/TamA family outer membrane protein [Muribaculaceae bacterium]|nr:BamA/TamA family outer membrane protein [Muribaculaceae bacterium]
MVRLGCDSSMSFSAVSVRILSMLVVCLALAACSSSKHVPEGSYLLDKVDIRLDSSYSGDGDIDVSEMQAYLRQTPNHKMLWSIKFRLGFYNMSGKDSTNWWNRWMRKLGEPPVIYDSLLAKASAEQLRQFLANKGYYNSEVEIDSTVNEKKRKVALSFNLVPGSRKVISSVDYEFPDSLVEAIVMRDSANFLAFPGCPLDKELLEAQRTLVTNALRNNGYYDFTSECVTFVADTTEGSSEAELLMRVSAPKTLHPATGRIFSRYLIRKVTVITNAEETGVDEGSPHAVGDSVAFKGLDIIYGDSRYLRPSVIADNCFLTPGEIFVQKDVDRTYRAFSRLGILKFINIVFRGAGSIGDEGLLDAYILLTPGKSQTASVELEGTNSEGDLGVAVGVTYSHRNLGKGSETFTAKARGSYESLSGNLEGLLHNRYMEYSADLSLSMPEFKAPISRRIRRRVQASTEVNLSLNYQERPEYTRVISTAGWSYKWVDFRKQNRHTFTPIDINYVYLPASTNDFIDQIAPDNPLLRYSYEDHFIMRMGWNWYHSNKREATPWQKTMQRDIYTVRFNAEIAGNLLFAISSIFAHRSDFHQNPYKIFGIHYSQYFKVEADYGFLHRFDERNAVALHAGVGVGVPYGNSEMLPFEKRFYGGGANGVRGWDVRTLGPGAYPGRNSVSDFINQCGDIRLELNAEYRAKLFWVIELGAFVDIGNIWTIRNYPNQPGGVFRFNRFYEQLAASYGLGLRLDFDYFLLRFDLGMKAHNPAMGERPWPLVSPDWHRDSSFHFSIGYPF